MLLPTSLPETAESAFARVVGTAQGVKSNIDGVRSLIANMPGDGNGGFIGWRHQADGSIVRVTVPIANVQPLVPLLDAAAATFA